MSQSVFRKQLNAVGRKRFQSLLFSFCCHCFLNRKLGFHWYIRLLRVRVYIQDLFVSSAIRTQEEKRSTVSRGLDFLLFPCLPPHSLQITHQSWSFPRGAWQTDTLGVPDLLNLTFFLGELSSPSLTIKPNTTNKPNVEIIERFKS